VFQYLYENIIFFVVYSTDIANAAMLIDALFFALLFEKIKGESEPYTLICH